MNSYFSIFGLLLLVCSAYGKESEWVRLSKSPPPKTPQQPGDSTTELECIAMGQPPPSIQWVVGDNEPESNVDAYEITSQDLDARAEIVSRFVIDHTNERERKFTCVARSGGKTARATTTLVQSKNLATSARELDGNKPRILSHYTRLFNPIGQNVILPCKATGKPDPDYSWKNQNDEIIGANDQRFRVLSTGDLRIFGLQFSDMGTYTCTAENVLSKDTAKTFVYPLEPEP